MTLFLILFTGSFLVISTFLFASTWDFFNHLVQKNIPPGKNEFKTFMRITDYIDNFLHKNKPEKQKIDFESNVEFKKIMNNGAIRLFLSWVVCISFFVGVFVLYIKIDTVNTINSIPKLVAELGTNNRSNTIEELADMGNAVINPLITTYYETENEIYRSGIADVIGQITDENAVDSLIIILRDQSPELRAGAAKALGIIRDIQAVEPLITALLDGDALVRSNAALSLGYLKDDRAVLPLIGSLNDEDQTVRVNAAKSLVIFVNAGDKRAVEPLMGLFDKNDYPVIAEISSFYVKRGKEGSEPVFIEALTLYGTVNTANDYLNCGNVILENAAREWATVHGYEIGRTNDENNVDWSSK